MKHLRKHHSKSHSNTSHNKPKAGSVLPFWAELIIAIGSVAIVAIAFAGFFIPTWYGVNGPKPLRPQPAAPTVSCDSTFMNECVQDLAWQTCGSYEDKSTWENRYNSNPGGTADTAGWCPNWREKCKQASSYENVYLTVADPSAEARSTSGGYLTNCQDVDSPQTKNANCKCTDGNKSPCFAFNRCKQFGCTARQIGCDSYSAPQNTALTASAGASAVSLILKAFQAYNISQEMRLKYSGERETENIGPSQLTVYSILTKLFSLERTAPKENSELIQLRDVRVEDAIRSPNVIKKLQKQAQTLKKYEGFICFWASFPFGPESKA